MKTIYILLTRTGTVPSKLIHAIKGVKFTHASIAIEPRTDRFFSYARRKPHNILIAGFIQENLHKGVFSWYPNNPCAVFSLEITDEAYNKIQNQIEYYMEQCENATYNITGFLTMIFGKGNRRELKHTCSQFVATMLEKSDAVKLPKPSQTILPTDFLNLPNLKPVYEGTLGNCYLSNDKQLK